eukprot:3127835-Pleurochrysis_carterae.AAC.1
MPQASMRHVCMLHARKTSAPNMALVCRILASRACLHAARLHTARLSAARLHAALPACRKPICRMPACAPQRIGAQPVIKGSEAC